MSYDIRTPLNGIIGMTADAFTESIQEAEKAGMNAYVTKPIEPEQLYQALAEQE